MAGEGQHGALGECPHGLPEGPCIPCRPDAEACAVVWCPQCRAATWHEGAGLCLRCRLLHAIGHKGA